MDNTQSIDPLPLSRARACFGAALLLGLIYSAPVARAANDCCSVTAVDPEHGTVTAKENASGRTWQFSVKNDWLLKQLAPGTTFGRDHISGIDVPAAALDPTWADHCCNVASTSPGTSGPLKSGTQAAPVQAAPGSPGQSTTPATLAIRELQPGVRLEATALRRLGARMVRLEFRIVNDSDADISLGDTHVFHYDGMSGTYYPSGFELVDYDGGMKYGVVLDENNTCLCSAIALGGETLPQGASRTYWAQITAPPANVHTVSLIIPGGVPPLDGLTIQ